jgi:hypothetical protein
MADDTNQEPKGKKVVYPFAVAASTALFAAAALGPAMCAKPQTRHPAPQKRNEPDARPKPPKEPLIPQDKVKIRPRTADAGGDELKSWFERLSDKVPPQGRDMS